MKSLNNGTCYQMDFISENNYMVISVSVSICSKNNLFLKVKEKLLVCVPFLQELFMLFNLNRLAETAFNTSSSLKSPLEGCLPMPEV